jgi:hypothetical protein
VAACGSTVAHGPTGQGAATRTVGDEFQAAATTASTAAGVVGPQAAATGAARATATTTARSAAGATTKTTAAIPATGRGWDAKYVYIGVVTQKDTQQVAESLGLNTIYFGDTEREANAIIADINGRGGILGRQIKPLFYDVHTIETNSNGAAVGEAVCTHFTQDQRVVAVWNISTQLDQAPNLRACLANAKVLLFTAAARAIDDRQLRELSPFYIHTVMVSWDKLASVLVARLKAQGWFGGWNPLLGQAADQPVKVGILADGSPQGARTAATLKNAIAAAGYAGTLVYQYTRPEDGQSSSVNYFNGNGVTHVIVTDVELTAFQNSAAPQRYRPRYGITTYNDPYSNLEASGLTPSGANNGAMGVGWVPSLDVSQANDPGITAAAKSCLQLMQNAGENVGTKRLAEAYSFSACDTFRLLAAGMTAAHSFVPADIFTGIAQIGPSFVPANGFAAALTAAKPYVQGVVRDLAWNTSCNCVQDGAAQTRL